MFEASPQELQRGPRERAQYDYVPVPDYHKSPATIFDHMIAFILGFAGMFLLLFVFYKIIALSILGGVLCGCIYIYVSSRKAVEKRKRNLRTQFFELLEALSVSMRAGNVELLALQNARDDLLLIYPENSDIIAEITNIVASFENNVPLSVSFNDFAERSGLEDIASFASVFKTIEGKGSRTYEIVQQTQQIISEKMEIEMEIDTLMLSAKTEVNIMLAMPIFILGIIGFLGAGFMDAIYTTLAGRLVATLGVVVFIISFVMARKFSNVEL